jgi:hypothetical protein
MPAAVAVALNQFRVILQAAQVVVVEELEH